MSSYIYHRSTSFHATFIFLHSFVVGTYVIKAKQHTLTNSMRAQHIHISTHFFCTVVQFINEQGIDIVCYPTWKSLIDKYSVKSSISRSPLESPWVHDSHPDSIAPSHPVFSALLYTGSREQLSEHVGDPSCS